MNKVFKIVFNAARGKMMVVNEATSSVQTGKKAAVTVAVVAALAAGSAVAATAEYSNQTNVTNDGGALRVLGGKSQTIKNDVFAGNKVTANGMWGGAIWNKGTLDVSDTTFDGNFAMGTHDDDGNSGGAIGAGTGSTTTITGSTFKNNEAFNDGGAIGGFGSLTIKDSHFESNTASTDTADTNPIGGGAIAFGAETVATISSVSNTLFKNNYSGTNGGAIATRQAKDATLKDATYKIDAKFVANEAKQNGGAIYNSFYKNYDSSAEGVQVSGEFLGNDALYGGAIYNAGIDANDPNDKSGGVMTITDSTFFDNEADIYGGAIFNGGKVTVKNSTFNQNYSGVGAGIATTTGSKGTVIEGSTFENNHARYDGGAIGSYNSLSVTDSVFKGNVAGYETKWDENDEYAGLGEVTVDDTAIGGGAIALGAVSKTDIVSIENTLFEGNLSGSNGGAIATRQAKYESTNPTLVDGTYKIEATFTSNEAGGDGGAIYNAFYKDYDSSAKGVQVSGQFSKNVAGNNGGAIYNAGLSADDSNDTSAGVMTIAGSTFADNTAKVAGGAIYNAGTIHFAGDNAFSGNKANGTRNDIHNVGTINVAGKLTLDGGISGNGTITFAEGSTLVARVAGSDAESTKIANDVVNNGAELQFVFDPGFSGQYQLTQGAFEGEEFTLNNSNSVFKVSTTDTKGTYSVVAQTSDAIADATGATSNQAGAILAIIKAAAPSEAPAAFKAVAQKITEALQSGNPVVIKQALAAVSAMSPTDAPVGQHVQTSTGSQVFGAVGQRFGGPKGKASGDVFAEQGLWVQGMLNKGELDDTVAVAGFDSDTYGFAMGFDGKVNDAVSVGFGYSFAKTDVDANTRKTDVDTHTIFAYGEYQPCAWYANAVMSYAWSDYEEKNSVLGQSLNAQYDAETFGFQVMTGYDFQVRNFQVTPEIGMRYFNTTQDRYTNSFGSTVSADDTDVFTAVAGVNAATTMTLGSGIVLTPEFHVAATYDMQQAEGGAFVTLVNGSSYRVEGEDLDRFGMEVGAKVSAEITDNLEVSASYEGNFRSDFASHTGMVKATYKF